LLLEQTFCYNISIMQTTVNILPKSQVEIKVVIPSQSIALKYEAVYQKLALSVNIPGFRPGKAPRNLIEANLGEEKIYQQVFDDLLFESYREAIKKHDLHPITYPQFKIEKFAKGKDLEVATTVSLRPKAKVGDYQKIKVKKKEPLVTAADVKKVRDDTFENWKKTKTGQQKTSQIEVAKTLSEAENKALQDKKLTFDEFMREVGVKDEEGLLQQIKIELEKQAQTKSELDFENAILDELVKMTAIDLPDVLIEHELVSMMKGLETQLVPLKIKLQDYLKEKNETEEKLKEKWKPVAEKRVKLEFALAEVTALEKIEVTEPEIEAVVHSVADQKIRAELEKPEQKVYIKYSLQREKTLEKLKKLASGN